MGRCVVKQKPGQGFPFYPYRTRRRSRPSALPEPVIFTRLPSPLRPPPGVIRRFSLPVATSTTFVMVGNPSSVPATITLMFFKSSLNSIRGEQRKVTLLTDGSNLASGPINGPSTPSELFANPKLYGRSIVKFYLSLGHQVVIGTLQLRRRKFTVRCSQLA